MTRHASRLYTSVLPLTWLMICAPFIAPLALAQTTEPIHKADPCVVVPEEIIPLLPPNLDQAAPWKKTVGVKGEDRPRAILAVADGGQIAIGESRAYDEKTGFSDRQLNVIRTDKTGKVVVSKWVPIADLQAVTDAVLLKNKIVVLTQVGKDPAKPAAVLQFLNGIGELGGSVSLGETGRHLIPKSLVVAQGGEKLVIAVQSVSDKNPADFNTDLLWTTTDGKQMMQRSYLPGVQNKPEYVGRLQNGDLVVTGRIMGADKRETGWVMKLAASGDIVFQRPYARGADSIVRSAVAYGSDGMVTAGDTIPSGAGDKAAWIMKLDGKGNIVWQKYMTGKYNYAGVDIATSPDGRISMLMAGRPSTFGGREHARIATFSTQGQMVYDESYLEGSNSIPVRFVHQNAMRYLLGTSETSVSHATVSDEARYVTYDTWLLGLAPLPVYQNECGEAPNRTLDDLP